MAVWAYPVTQGFNEMSVCLFVFSAPAFKQIINQYDVFPSFDKNTSLGNKPVIMILIFGHTLHNASTIEGVYSIVSVFLWYGVVWF